MQACKWKHSVKYIINNVCSYICGFQIYVWDSTVESLADLGSTPLGFTSCIAAYASDFPLNLVDQQQFCFFSCNNLTVIKSINLVFSVEVRKQATSVACSEHKITYF